MLLRLLKFFESCTYNKLWYLCAGVSYKWELNLWKKDFFFVGEWLVAWDFEFLKTKFHASFESMWFLHSMCIVHASKKSKQSVDLYMNFAEREGWHIREVLLINECYFPGRYYLPPRRITTTVYFESQKSRSFDATRCTRTQLRILLIDLLLDKKNRKDKVWLDC